jgi:hypothetical protein
MEGMWKEEVVRYFEVLSRYLSHGSRCPDRDFNQGPPEHETELLLIWLQRLAEHRYINWNRFILRLVNYEVEEASLNTQIIINKWLSAKHKVDITS